VGKQKGIAALMNLPGRTGWLQVLPGIRIRARIIEFDQRYGKVHVRVEPEGDWGEGQRWFWLEKMELDSL